MNKSTLASNLVLASTAVVVGAQIVAWNRRERKRQEELRTIPSPAQQQADKAMSGGPWCGSGMPYTPPAPWGGCDELLNAVSNLGLQPSEIAPGTNDPTDAEALQTAVRAFQGQYNAFRRATILLEDGKLGNATAAALAEVASTLGLPVDVRVTPSLELTQWWMAGGSGGQVDPQDPELGKTVPRAVGLEVESDTDYNFLDNAVHMHASFRRGGQELLDYINYILERRPTGYSIEYRQIPTELAIQTSEGGKPRDHIHSQVITQIGAEKLANGETFEIQSGWGEEVGSDDREWHKHQFFVRAIIEQVPA